MRLKHDDSLNNNYRNGVCIITAYISRAFDLCHSAKRKMRVGCYSSANFRKALNMAHKESLADATHSNAKINQQGAAAFSAAARAREAPHVRPPDLRQCKKGSQLQNECGAVLQ
jgi:hypothetical protein